MSEQITVLEFAVEHCKEHSENTRDQVQAHIDGLIHCAAIQEIELWEVVVDDDGRHSLIWVSNDRDAWEELLATSIRFQRLTDAVKGALGK